MSPLLLLAASLAAAAPPPLEAVPSVDLARYMGTWYEIAHLPNHPQKGCTDTVVHYRLRADGGFDLANTCWKGAKYKPYFGTARPWAPGETARFRARFFLLLGADYWILDLDPAYRWAAVGEPGRRRFWIISREPTLDEAVYQGILRRASAQGYELSALQRTVHTGKPSKGFEDQKSSRGRPP